MNGIITRKFQSKITWLENKEHSKVAHEDYKYAYYFFGIKIFEHNYEMFGGTQEATKNQVGFSK